MAIEKVEGIILGETNYSESSKILKIYTREYGIISVISKGCRNLKSKLRGVSNKLVYANFHIYYKENGISTLKEADVIDTLRNIFIDIDKIYKVSFITDLVEQVYKQSGSDEIFPIFISIVKKINEDYDSDVLISILELKLLDFLGIGPNVDECSICGNTSNILTFSTKDGGFICQNCYKCGKIYSSQIVKLVRMFIYIDVNNISKISLSNETKKELSELIEDYYETYSGIYLKKINSLIKE